MSIEEQKTFLKKIHPFEKLDDSALSFADKCLNIAYYKKGEVLISPLKQALLFYIIIKGEVSEYLDDELVKVYGENNSFDSDALIYEKTNYTYKVTNELLCFEISKENFLKLLDLNTSFKEYFLTNLANKIQSAKQKEQIPELSGFLVTRIKDIYLHEACIVEPDTPVIKALKRMDSMHLRCILVDFPVGYGIVTDSAVRQKVILKGYDVNLPISGICTRPVISIDENDFLFNAMLELTKHSIKRIVVLKNSKVKGILEQLDLLSFLSNHSFLVLTQIKKAKSIDDLKQANLQITQIIKTLQAKGTNARYISGLVNKLNAHIYKKIYEIIMPKKLQDKACFIVLGSEGRGEQILKTDQDNALIIKNDENINDFLEPSLKINQTLLEFGLPPCKGNVMISNEYWRKEQRAYKRELERWFENPSLEDIMNLAIFFDASVIAGEEKLLNDLKEYIFSHKLQDVFIAKFANQALQFATPINIFSNLKSHDNKLDLKKGGIFAIVHGVRALSLVLKIKQTNSWDRLDELKKQNITDEILINSVKEALDTLIAIRLKYRLIDNEMQQNSEVNLKKLSHIELELLKDSFKIIDKFKKFISHYFRLNLLS